MLEKAISELADELSFAFMERQRPQPKLHPTEEDIQEFLDSFTVGDPESFFADDGYVPEIEFKHCEDRFTYDIYTFRFPSAVKSSHEENDVVHGYRYILHEKPDAPSVILLHGWRMENYLMFDAYPRIFARMGFNSYLLDLPFHMKRRPKDSYSGEWTLTGDFIRTAESFRQSISDVRALYRWLSAGEGPGVGLFGISFGGLLTGIMACLEKELNFAVMAAPPADPYEMFQKSRIGKLAVKDAPRRMLKLMREQPEVMQVISPLHMQPKIPKEKILLMEGRYDRMVATELVEKLWEAWGRPPIRRYNRGHLSILFFNPQLERDLRRFIKKAMAQETAEAAER